MTYSRSSVLSGWLLQRRFPDKEANPEAQPEAELLMLETALNEFNADARRRNLAGSTLLKYELLFKQLREFAQNMGLRYLKGLDVATTRKLCEIWAQGSLTVRLRRDRIIENRLFLYTRHAEPRQIIRH